jgi:hypothetical protein
MTKIAALLCLTAVACTVACSTQRYHEQVLNDGKTWNITVNQVADKEEMKAEVTKRGQFVCGKEPFRVVNCSEKLKGPEVFNAVCTIKCGEKPFLAKERTFDKKAAAALKKEADEATEIE